LADADSASVEHGYWYARSAEFLQTEIIQTLRWLRFVGDTILAVGIVALILLIAVLTTGWSVRRCGGWSAARRQRLHIRTSGRTLSSTHPGHCKPRDGQAYTQSQKGMDSAAKTSLVMQDRFRRDVLYSHRVQ
jgi:hypothetical protein